MAFLGLDSRGDLPRVSYSTALDNFIGVCFTFVLATIIQFAAVHFFTKFGSGEDGFKELQQSSHQSDGQVNTSPNKSNCVTNSTTQLTYKDYQTLIPASVSFSHQKQQNNDIHSSTDHLSDNDSEEEQIHICPRHTIHNHFIYSYEHRFPSQTINKVKYLSLNYI